MQLGQCAKNLATCLAELRTAAQKVPWPRPDRRAEPTALSLGPFIAMVPYVAMVPDVEAGTLLYVDGRCRGLKDASCFIE